MTELKARLRATTAPVPSDGPKPDARVTLDRLCGGSQWQAFAKVSRRNADALADVRWKRRRPEVMSLEDLRSFVNELVIEIYQPRSERSRA
jgi:hypothetical protein